MQAFQSFTDKIKSVKQTDPEGRVDQIPPSDNQPGTSKQTDLQNVPITSHSIITDLISRVSAEPMETEFVGPPLPPHFSQRSEADPSGQSSINW